MHYNNTEIYIAVIRDDFPILKQNVYNKPLVYLDNAATTQKPGAVIERISSFYSQSNSNIHRGVHYLSEQASSAYENAREAVSGFIHSAKSSEIIFTRGATEAINLITSVFGEKYIHEDDEIVITEMEHHSNIVPWQNLCERKNARVRIIPFNDDGELGLKNISKYINEKTKLISVTYVSNVLGTINEINRLIELAHQYDIPVMVDAAQAIPHLPVNVLELDCDFLVFSGHKMYAETGIGVLYGKEYWLETLPPYQFGGGMISHVSFDKTTYDELPFKFEAGTPHIAGAISLQAAIEYINGIGFDAIQAHENEVYSYALERLEELKELTIYSKATKRCASVAFNLDGIHHYDAGVILDKLGVAVRTGKLCAEPTMKHFKIPGCIRASFALYNSFEDIDILIEGIEKVKTMFN